MYSFSMLLTLVVASVTVACGGNPITAVKERDRAEKRVRDSEVANEALQYRNYRLKTALANAVSTTSATWATPTTANAHADAQHFCEEIGYTLPTKAQLAEFKTEIYDHSSSWNQIPFTRFFAADVVEDQPIFGIVLCRRHQNPGPL